MRNTIGPMPRPRTGTIIRKPTKLGTSFGLRFTYRGEKLYHHIGGSWEGWSDQRVEDERRYVMAQVDRGEYLPQRRSPTPMQASHEIPTFQVFASIVLARKLRRVSHNTYKDLKWRLETAVDHFGPYRIDEIDSAVADAFVEAKLVEREKIEEATAAGRPPLEEYIDVRTGRKHQRRRRALSNGSINKVLVGVRRVLKEAKRRGLLDSNALDDPECYLKAQAPKRSFLQVAQIDALFDAAREVDKERRRLEWRDINAIRASNEPATRLARIYGVSETLVRSIRRGEIWTKERPREGTCLPIVATLVLAGPRVSELCKLDRSQVDMAARTVRVPRVKTDASERVIPMLPALHDVLVLHRAEQASKGGAAFRTRNGTRQHSDNVRSGYWPACAAAPTSCSRSEARSQSNT